MSMMVTMMVSYDDRSVLSMMVTMMVGSDDRSVMSMMVTMMVGYDDRSVMAMMVTMVVGYDDRSVMSTCVHNTQRTSQGTACLSPRLVISCWLLQFAWCGMRRCSKPIGIDRTASKLDCALHVLYLQT